MDMTLEDIYSLIQHFLKAYYVVGTMLGTGGTISHCRQLFILQR